MSLVNQGIKHGIINSPPHIPSTAIPILVSQLPPIKSSPNSHLGLFYHKHNNWLHSMHKHNNWLQIDLATVGISYSTPVYIS